MINYKIFKIFAFLIISFPFLSCEEVIFSDDISKDVIVVLAPQDSTIVRETDVKFSWEALEGATSYKVQVAKPNFEEASQIVLDSITSELFFMSSLNAADYQWRVKGTNNAYETPYTVQSFTVVGE